MRDQDSSKTAEVATTDILETLHRLGYSTEDERRAEDVLDGARVGLRFELRAGGTIESPGWYVCWHPNEESEPVKLRANTAVEAAKIFVLRGLGEGTRHDNDWSSEHVIVVNYETSDSSWVTVKVTVEASP